MRPSHLEKSIESCRQCTFDCNACAAACKEDGGLEECMKICLDCALICELTMTLGENQTPLHKKACRLCEEACLACATECEKHNKDYTKRCATQCRICAEDCKAVFA